MTNPNDCAHPTIEQGGNPAHWSTSAGLTKREHFAALAMQGILADGTSESHLSDLAVRAVRVADYLIIALNAKQ